MGTITGTGSAETLTGDNDTVSGFSDTMFGDAGNDLINGLTGNDSITGGAGDDTMDGGVGNDVFIMGTADVAGGDNDVIIGGDGIDTADYSAGGQAINANLSGTTDTVNPNGGGFGNSNTDTLVGVENIIGSALADSITGDNQSNLLDGRGGTDSLVGLFGNDTLYGGDDVDTLYGGADNDLLDGGAGAESLFGGSGRDTLIGGTGNAADTLSGGQGLDFADYSSSNAAVQVNLSDAAVETGGHAQGDTLIGIEGVIGSSLNDLITGDANANVIDGGGDADTIFGGFGSDSIQGGAGNDVIDAGPDTAPPATPANALDLRLDWDANPATTGGSIEAPFTQNAVTGANTAGNQINVQVTYSEDAGSSQFTEDEVTVNIGGNNVTTSVPIYAPTDEIPGGREFDANSAGALARNGGPGLSEVAIEFSAVGGAGVTDEVQNVYFRISDIDTSNDATGFRDQVTVLAYDALGNPIQVFITPGSSQLVVSGNTVTAVPQTGDPNGFNTSPGALDGSALFFIPGPVGSIVIQYGDVGTTGSPQAIFVSDVLFTTIPENADNADDDTVAGGIGDDVIQAGIGADSLAGDEGNDSLLGEAGNDSLYGGDNDDTIDGGDNDDLIFGGAGNDSLVGGIGNDTIDGGLNDDRILGGAGNDSLVGNDGNDSIDGGLNDDRIFGGAGNDSLVGNDGNDSIDGGQNDDLIFGGAGIDSIFGNAGSDTIEGGAGDDSLFGGTENDLFLINVGDVDSLAGDEVIQGGGPLGGPIANDFDVIDLQAYGWSRVDVIYDILGDPTGETGTIIIYLADGVTEIGRIQFTEIENIIPCFTPGTMILSDRGEVRVETLRPGDLVVTRDHGLQPLRWVGHRVVPYVELLANPDLQPVRIGAGALQGVGPDRSMLVSPQHRVLLDGARAELLFGTNEVLVPAKHLVGHGEVTRALPSEGVTYIHILFDRHEIVQSDGIWTESFQPAERMLSAMDEAVRAEVLALFPQLAVDAGAYEGARLSLKAHEAKVLLSV
jgi:Ca2+-binding RTX toxin-like protein